MIRLFLLLQIILLFYHQSNGQGAAQAALGGTGVTQNSVFAATDNPAGIANVNPSQIGITNRQTLYALKVQDAGVYATLRLKQQGVFGVFGNYYGNHLLNHNSLGMAYARVLKNKVSIGTSLAYNRLKIEQNGQLHTMAFGLGLQIEATDKIKLGSSFHHRISNIETKYGNTNMKIGASYRPSSLLMLVLEIEKNWNEPLDLKTAVAYHIHPHLILRLGGGIQPSVLAFGFGTHVGKLIIDFATSWIVGVGMIPEISLSYKLFKIKANEN